MAIVRVIMEWDTKHQQIMRETIEGGSKVSLPDYFKALDEMADNLRDRADVAKDELKP